MSYAREIITTQIECNQAKYDARSGKVQEAYAQLDLIEGRLNEDDYFQHAQVHEARAFVDYHAGDPAAAVIAAETALDNLRFFPLLINDKLIADSYIRPVVCDAYYTIFLAQLKQNNQDLAHGVASEMINGTIGYSTPSWQAREMKARREALYHKVLISSQLGFQWLRLKYYFRATPE